MYIMRITRIGRPKEEKNRSKPKSVHLESIQIGLNDLHI